MSLVTSRESTWVTLATAPNPGAVALIQVHGPGAVGVLGRLTGIDDWPRGRLRLVRMGEIDEGLAASLRGDWVELMPHGGPRVVQRLMEWLDKEISELGSGISDLKRGVSEPPLADPKSDPGAPGRNPRLDVQATPAQALYPEAASDLEADMLFALSRAASPAAVDLLLAQPALWRGAAGNSMDWAKVEKASRVMDRLLEPATVAVVGRPNVGKSTLSNRLLGRSASVVADLPGTTRDWVAGVVEMGGVAVRWIDTPGLRESDDAIEQRAIELAGAVVARADVVVALRDSSIRWPDPADLPRRPDLWALTQADLAPHQRTGTGRRADSPLILSAQTGSGIKELEAAVLTALGWHGAASAGGLWAFSPFLRQAAARDGAELRKYVGV